MAEIPIWVYDRPKWVSGITPATTCQDILGSLATSQSGSLIHPEDLKHLILTEKWRDVEKPLAKDSKILKIWSAWGDEQKFVKFIVKRISRKSHHRGKTGRLRHHRRGSVSSVHSHSGMDELHPKALVVKKEDNIDIEDKKFRENDFFTEKMKKIRENDFTEKMINNNDDDDDDIPQDQKNVIEEMMKIIEMQRAVISEELMKAKKKAAKAKKEDELKAILEEMLKLSQLNDKLQFAEESVDRLEIALKQQLKQKSSHPSNSISNNQQQNHRHCGEIVKNSSSSSTSEDQHLISDHLACAKDEVSRLRSANDKAALEVKDNQKALDAMEQSKAERKQALKRLEYDVNVIEKEGRKLAKEYEKVLNINLDDILNEDPKANTTDLQKVRKNSSSAAIMEEQQVDSKSEFESRTGSKQTADRTSSIAATTTTETAEDYEEEEIYTLLNSSSSTSSSYTSTVSCTTTKQDHQENHSTTSGHSSDTNNQSCVQELIAKESPIDIKNVNSNQNDENNSDTGLSSLHTSSDDGIYEVGTLV